MKVIGLLSGGKDSCFNLLECLANGHPPIAVAGLLPPPLTDELDSFMYQTVGLSLLPTIANALRLPVYTRIIQGKPINVEGEYGDRETEGDETEDLLELLKVVKEHHPDAEAVSVGAILSSYQRIRVEHVCARLNLIPLTYLWQQPQETLLPRMVHSGLRAILVKVAGVGLKEEHLGKDLGQMWRELFKLNSIYGLHICGEGGEYETVTLDSPMFHDTIVLEETTTELTDPSPVAPVAHLLIHKASLQPKTGYAPLTTAQARTLLGYDTDEDDFGDRWLDDEGKEVREAVLEVELRTSRSEVDGEHVGGHGWDQRVSVCRKDGWVAIGGVSAFDRPREGEENELSIEDEVKACFKRLQDALYPDPLSSLQSLTLYISSMSLFPLVNKTYSTYFHSSPPSRACVEVPLPQGVRVLMDGIAFSEKQRTAGGANRLGLERRGLHVQGLSYWAPANIGPYSQAVIVNGRITLAGQIPLIPSSLTLPAPPSFAVEAALSLKHVRSIIRALKEGTGGSDLKRCFVEGCIGWVADWTSLEGAREAWKVTLEAEANSEKPLFLTLPKPPPTLFVQPSALPRLASVEWQPFLHTGQLAPSSPSFSTETSTNPDGLDSEDEYERTYEPMVRLVDHSEVGEWMECAFVEGNARWGLISLRSIDLLDSREAPEWAKGSLSASFALKVFHHPSISPTHLKEKIEAFLDADAPRPAMTFIPVDRIATLSNEWQVAVVWSGV